MSATFTPAPSAMPIIRITALPEFLRELRQDSESIRHREIRWVTQPVTQIADQHVLFETLIAGYITERGGRPAIIELRQLCGAIASDRRCEDAHTQEQIAAALQALQTAAHNAGLDVKPGRFTLDPSPLTATPDEALRRFGPTFTSAGATTYSPWTDGRGVGVECVRPDGLCSYLYLKPGQEPDDGRATVYCHLGTGGDPSEDVVQHEYDPFDRSHLAHAYRIVTKNGERNWTAEDAEHARRQHEEAFGGEPGETIQYVYRTCPYPEVDLPRIHIDSVATEEAILDGMMRLAQRMSGHPQSPWIAVIDSLRHVKEATGA